MIAFGISLLQKKGEVSQPYNEKHYIQKNATLP